jgi:CheY-like chemotaxis protein
MEKPQVLKMSQSSMSRNDGVPEIAARIGAASESARVLLVEDNLAHQRLMTLLLHRLGTTVVLAANGQEGFEAILGGEPATLILMDLHMPRFDGYEATQQIRQWETKNAEPRHIIIALTADTHEEVGPRCLAVGMDDVLTKPVSFENLRTRLGRWLPAPLVQISTP